MSASRCFEIPATTALWGGVKTGFQAFIGSCMSLSTKFQSSEAHCLFNCCIVLPSKCVGSCVCCALGTSASLISVTADAAYSMKNLPTCCFDNPLEEIALDPGPAYQKMPEFGERDSQSVKALLESSSSTFSPKNTTKREPAAPLQTILSHP